jgi:hypothetical protein
MRWVGAFVNLIRVSCLFIKGIMMQKQIPTSSCVLSPKVWITINKPTYHISNVCEEIRSLFGRYLWTSINSIGDGSLMTSDVFIL